MRCITTLGLTAKVTLAASSFVCCQQAVADVLTPATEAKAAKPTLTFCYEDKQLLPYYTANSHRIPKQPGATIEHLQRAADSIGLRLKLKRMPWLRCLQQLEENTVDAIVADYDEERISYTKYPTQSDGKADRRYAINQLGLCLAHRFDNPLKQKLQANSSFTISRPLGYKSIPFPENALLIAVQSPDKALDLVVSGRVDATTVLCQLNGIDTLEQHLNTLPVEVLSPPIHHSFGYLMLSKAFYQQHQQLSEQLWQALPRTLDKQRYLEYLQQSY